MSCMKWILSVSAATCLVVAAGCVNGRLNPAVEPIAAGVLGGACKFVPSGATIGPATGAHVDGEAACALLADLIDGALRLFSTSPFAADAGAEVEKVESQLRYRGEVVYRGTTRRAAYLFHRLVVDDRFRADVDRALDGAGVPK
jgi:hypothetical protein